MAKNTAKQDLANAAQDALRLISNASDLQLKTIANAAAEALKVTNIKGGNDHDLIVTLIEQMRTLQKTVEKLSESDNTYVLKDDFNFWKNIIVGGMLLTIFTSVIMNYFVK